MSLDPIRTALGLSRSIALCGEAWSPDAEQAYKAAHEALSALEDGRPQPGQTVQWVEMPDDLIQRVYALESFEEDLVGRIREMVDHFDPGGSDA